MGRVEPESGAADSALRVLLACDHIDHDGALHGGGRQLIELVRELERRPDVEPVVCVLRPASGLGETLVEEGLPLRFFGDHQLNPATLFRLIQVIRREGIHVLHLTDFGASTFGRIASRLTGTPAIVQVITHHSEFQPRGYPRYVEWAFRALAPWTDRVLAISNTVRDFAADRMGFDSDEIEVLPYPLPKHSFRTASPDQVEAVRHRHGLAAGTPLVGAVTRFHQAKGIGYLLAAWPDVLAREPEARLILVGKGPLEGELRQQCRVLEIQDRVVFAGFQRDVAAYVQAFDLAVVPSIEEGFGLVALEAMALGCPVVASRVGGLPEIVEDGVSGKLIPPADTDSLSRAIAELLADREERVRIGGGGGRLAQQFALEGYVDRLQTIYQELRDGHA